MVCQKSEARPVPSVDPPRIKYEYSDIRWSRLFGTRSSRHSTNFGATPACSENLVIQPKAVAQTGGFLEPQVASRGKPRPTGRGACSVWFQEEVNLQERVSQSA